MRINYNVSAMLSNNALANNDVKLANSLQRLSSGLKINRAKDNPSGLAMSKRMNAQIEGLSVANQNSADGVSIIETADGALGEITQMIQRMNELAVKSANGTMTDGDREIIQEEMSQLRDEIERVAETTQFNGQNLLDGTFSVKGYTNVPGVTVNSFSKETPAVVYTIDTLTLDDETEEIELEDGTKQTVKTGNKKITAANFGEDFPEGTEATIENDFITISDKKTFEIKLDVNQLGEGSVSLSGMTLDLMDVGPMRLQVGANEGQILAVDIPNISLRNLYLDEVDVTTAKGSGKAIEQTGKALQFISSVRGRLGAYQNRLESTINNLNVTSDNMTSAYSRIMDVDMAEEMTQYTTNQVLTQAGTSMLAQANERPSQVLQLLQ